MGNCSICHKQLDENTPGAHDCGGDCSECMLRAGDIDVGLLYMRKCATLRDELQTAVYRINDMLHDPDGQSFKEARKWAQRVCKAHGLKNHPLNNTEGETHD